ncbi:MAG: gamma-glutamyltransferase [Bacteroidales bacterium]
MSFYKETICISFLFVLLISGCTRNEADNSNSLSSEGQFITSDSGMVVSAHPESSRVGIKILRKGGNAMDAAAAVEFALAVCYPEAGNLGGGGFMVIRKASGETDAIDYREKAPAAAKRDMFLDSAGNVIRGLSTNSHLACGVPGTVDGIIKVHSKYGKLPFSEIIQPAIDLAEKGFPVTAVQAKSLNANRINFIERNRIRPAFVKDSLWKEGDTLIQPELANTLKLIRDYGRDGFYKGITAQRIEAEMKRGNGLITSEDLASYDAQWREPVTGIYRGYRIITAPPPSGGGIILLQLLGMVENFPLRKWGFHSAKAIHIMIEAEKRAFADRAEFLGDPDYVKIPVNGLINKRYLKSRISNVDYKKASSPEEITAGNPEWIESEETTHYSVVDALGNAVAATTTLNATFGTSIVVEGAGFLLNNQMDDFSIKPGYPNIYGLTGSEANSIQPGKRMLSSMTPAIVEKNNKLFLVLGSPGGSTIPTSVFQVIVNVIDFRMSIKDAVIAGRFHNQWLPDQTDMEKESIDSLTITVLRNFGHKFYTRSAIGRVNAIMIDKNGLRNSGADPRGNNVACGY